MVRFYLYFYVTEIVVPLKDGKLGWLYLNKALKSRELPLLSDFDRKIPYFILFVKNDIQKWISDGNQLKNAIFRFLRDILPTVLVN